MVFPKFLGIAPLNKKSKKFDQQNTIFVKRRHSLLFPLHEKREHKRKMFPFYNARILSGNIFLPEFWIVLSLRLPSMGDDI